MKRKRQSIPPLLLRGTVLALVVLSILWPEIQGRMILWGISNVPLPRRPSTARWFPWTCRGGASSNPDKAHVFLPLAQALRPYLTTNDKKDDDDDITITDIAQALQALSASQQTFKGLDGVAHEAYQRTHTQQDISLHVSGRAMRTVARTQAVALGLGACELCELVATTPSDVDKNGNDNQTSGSLQLSSLNQYRNGTLADKQVLLYQQVTVKYQKTSLTVKVLVLFDPHYRGGAGLEYGNLFDEVPSYIHHGQLLITLGTSDASMEDMFRVLKLPAQLVKLQTTQNEAGSVQPLLYRAASQVLQTMTPVIHPYNTSAIHIVGHSLAGGVATILATILEGHVAPHKATTQGVKRAKKGQGKTSSKVSESSKNKFKIHENGETALSNLNTDSNNATATVGCGWGRGRTSAVVLGSPPSVSANVPADALITNIVYGDDWVSRATDTSLQRLLSRVQPILKRRKSLFTKQAALLSDTLKLATQGLTAHAHGREGEETRLTSTIGSHSYLLRPRRYENHVSIHEMGRASGREAIRAAVLWQLSDILLSPSFAKHHTLNAYIDGLDRVYVRGLDDGKQANMDFDSAENWDQRGEVDEEDMEEEANETEYEVEEAENERSDGESGLQTVS